MADAADEREDTVAAPLRRALPSRAADSSPRTEARKRPDPRPMRLAFGAGALAALSVMSVGLVRFGSPTTNTAVTTSDGPGSDLPPIEIRHVVRYVHLKPGQVAPPGAKVITPGAPAPRVVVSHIAAPTRQPRRIVVTRQSGRP